MELIQIIMNWLQGSSVDNQFKDCCRKDGMCLGTIPSKLISYGLCKSSCKQNALALQHVPSVLKTKELCTMACRKNGLALQYVPYRLRSKELCEIACVQNSDALSHVPIELKTQEMRQLAAGYICYHTDPTQEREYLTNPVHKHLHWPGTAF